MVYPPVSVSWSVQQYIGRVLWYTLWCLSVGLSSSILAGYYGIPSGVCQLVCPAVYRQGIMVYPPVSVSWSVQQYIGRVLWYTLWCLSVGLSSSGGVLWYTLWCLSVHLSVHTSFLDNSSCSFQWIVLKLGGQLDHEMVQCILF